MKSLALRLHQAYRRTESFAWQTCMQLRGGDHGSLSALSSFTTLIAKNLESTD